MAVVNDIHSQLNRCEVLEVVEVTSLDDVQTACAERGRKTPGRIAGGRHAMGGQQFCAGGLLLDTRGLDRVLDFDAETRQDHRRGRHPVARAPPRASARETPWAIAQKQTGADRLSLGGAIAANIHGRGLTLPPLVADIE